MKALITKQREVRCTSWPHEEQVLMIIRFIGIPIFKSIQDKIQLEQEDMQPLKELLLRKVYYRNKDKKQQLD